MGRLLQDVKYALRILAKSPGFSAIAILTLALAIGATTAIFSVIDAVLLHPIDVRDIGHLVEIDTIDTKTFIALGIAAPKLGISFPNFKDMRDANNVFSAASAFAPTAVTLTGRGEPLQLTALLVSANYFEVLGVRAEAGRTFLPGEDAKPGGNPVAVLSDSLWQRQFGGNPEVIGQHISLNGTSYTVIGVARKGFNTTFAFPPQNVVYVPISMYGQTLSGLPLSFFNDRRFLGLLAFGRLRAGVSRGQAEAQLKVIAAHLEAQYPTDNRGRSLVLSPLVDAAVGVNNFSQFLRAGGMVLGVVALVLLIACANLAGLLLARSLRREREFVVRAALGAAPGRLVAQLFTESVLLALVGGAAGLLVAWGGKTALWALRPAFLANSSIQLSFNARILAFTFLVALASAVLFGLLPALRVARANWSEALKSGSRGSSVLAGRTRIRGALVAAEVALAVVVLTLAGLFARSFQRAQSLALGFDPNHLAMMNIDLSARRYPTGQGEQFFQQVLERIRALPGVTDASVTSGGLFGAGFARTTFHEGDQQTPGKRGSLTSISSVSVAYFRALRVPLLRGRFFTDTDRQGTAPVAIVNAAMVRHFWPNQNPIGQRFTFFGDSKLIQVVGVVGDTAGGTVGGPPLPQIFQPLLQEYSPAGTIVVRSSVAPETVIGVVRGQIQSLDHDLAITNALTADELIRQNLWAPRMGAGLLGLFALLAVVLAAVGLYGVLAYSVSQRTGEIGLRMALGATPTEVFRLILAQGGSLALAGLAAGLAGALALGHVVQSLLFGVSGADPLTFAAVAGLLALVALAACLIPARRATRVAPVAALRYE